MFLRMPIDLCIRGLFFHENWPNVGRHTLKINPKVYPNHYAEGFLKKPQGTPKLLLAQLSTNLNRKSVGAILVLRNSADLASRWRAKNIFRNCPCFKLISVYGFDAWSDSKLRTQKLFTLWQIWCTDKLPENLGFL